MLPNAFFVAAVDKSFPLIMSFHQGQILSSEIMHAFHVDGHPFRLRARSTNSQNLRVLGQRQRKTS